MKPLTSLTFVWAPRLRPGPMPEILPWAKPTSVTASSDCDGSTTRPPVRMRSCDIVSCFVSMRFLGRDGERQLVEEGRGSVGLRTLDGKHAEFCLDAAWRREAAGLAAGRQHAVAGHDDRIGIAAQGLADLAGEMQPAHLLGDVAIGARGAGRDQP